MVQRVLGILTAPLREWTVIDQEKNSRASLVRNYLLPLILIGAAAIFVGYSFVGIEAFIIKIKGYRWGAWFAIRHVLASLLSFFVAVYVVDLLAPVFDSEKHLNKSAQLVAYSYTPVLLAALFQIVPALWFFSLIGLYGIYLYYTGLPILKKTPADKRITYMVVTALVFIVVIWLSQWAIERILNLLIGDPYEGSLNEVKKLFQE